MSKIVKAVKKGIKKIAKGIRTGFRSIRKSTIGKVLMFAAAVYLGGAAFGAWQSPFASINGAFVQGAAQGAGAAGGGLADAAVAATGQTAAEVAAVQSGTAAAGVGAGNLVSPAVTHGLSAGQAASTANMVNPSIAHGIAEAGAQQGTGILNTAMEGAKKYGTKALEFAKDNKSLTAMGLSAISSAVQGEEARKQAEKQRKREEDAMLAGGSIDLGLSNFRSPILNSRG